MGFIINFQKANGLFPDGIIGKRTLLKVKEILGKSNEQCAHFMGQCAHESGNFKVLEENLNYSAKRLLQIFPKYFTSANVAEYANSPVKIANRVYANRMGNGNEQSGDGWKFRGRGIVQLTGKNNYTNFSTYIKDPLILENPDLVLTKYALESAKYFFDVNNVWQWCKAINTESVLNTSKVINLGSVKSKLTPHGLSERTLLTNRFYNMIIK